MGIREALTKAYTGQRFFELAAMSALSGGDIEAARSSVIQISKLNMAMVDRLGLLEVPDYGDMIDGAENDEILRGQPADLLEKLAGQ